MSLNKGGGDTKTAQARQEIARREEQIVALRLRHRSFGAIGRVVGVSKQAAQKAYFKALHRNTDQDISTHHRSELAELDAEASAAWELVDTKDSPKARAAGLAALNRIHIRRAHLLGLDAPTKLDVRGLYRTGIDEISAERQARRAVLEALPIEEQRRIFEVFYQARKRVEAGDFSQPAIETTVNNGSNQRSAPDESDDGAEHNDEN
jgi:hypothetical protein